MAKARPNVYLHPKAHEALEALQQALPAQGLPRQSRRQDIVSAMLLYSTPQQVAGMLTAFLRAGHGGDES